MAQSRPQQGPQTHRRPVYVRLSPAGLAAIDRLRGGWTRSEWLRQACAQAAKAGLRGPAPAPPPDTGF